MKNKIIYCIFHICFLMCWETSIAQNPTYTLDVNDGILVAPNIFEFDIDMAWTNSGSVSNFEYAGAQYFFNINGAIANGGTMTMSNAGSDLPTSMQPRGPTVFSGTTPWQLRWAVNTFPGAGSGFQMPANVAVKIVRVRLTTTAAQFANASHQLQWRNYLPNPFTKVFAYVGTTNTEISTPPTHTISIGSSFPNQPFILTIKAGIEGLMKNGVHVKKDSVRIYLREVSHPYQIRDSAVLLLDSNTLTATKIFILPFANYYIVIKHCNSLETWSRAGGEPLGGSSYFYDFTTSASQAFGNNLILVGSVYCMFSGNINGDDIIDAEDLIHTDNDVYNYAPSSSITNLNGDQIVDIEDLAICEKNARALRIVQWPGMPANRLNPESPEASASFGKVVP